MEDADAAPRETLRLAYLTTAYPEVSHTFVRREILTLEARGHRVLRLSIREPSSTLVDPLDLSERQRTLYGTSQPLAVMWATARVVVRTPLRFAEALALTLRMSRLSERGVLRHLAYLAEACFVLSRLRREAIEHLHVHFGHNAAAVARLARRLGGPRYSITVHGPDEFDAPIGLSLGAKVQESAFSVAISHYASAQLRRWLPLQAWPKIALVRCTVGAEFEGIDEPARPHSDTLLCVGRLSAQKGHRTLLDAFERLVREGVDARLVLAGDGELRESLEVYVRERGIADRVAITGWVSGERVRELLRECRALVLPSFAEGLPVVIMEAFAMQRPVISTFVGAIPELVEPGVSGWLVPAGDEGALVDAMRDALQSAPARLEAFGRAGRARVLAQHTCTTEVAKLEALFLAARTGGA
ncbi:MAG: colanic acid biosynthesis glycosyltransferase WcaL [Myxococcales bacterium]|nr:MAG: colanic acid biosynthesis glycosyltransferase WcaL [Myxococcales bacterium]